MTPRPVIDSATISNLRDLGGDDDDFLGEIVSIFLADTPARIGELESGLGLGDPERFLRAAHSIKGSAANLGAARLQLAAERLESQARQSGAEGLAPLLAELKSEFALVQAELSKYQQPQR